MAVLRAALPDRRDGSGLRARRAVLPDAVVPGRAIAGASRRSCSSPRRSPGWSARRSSGLVLGHLNGVLGMAGWHWLFLARRPALRAARHSRVAGASTDRIEDAGWLSDVGEGYLVPARIAKQDRSIGEHSLLRRRCKTPGFLTLGLVYFLIQIASYGLNFWAPHLIRAAGGDQSDVIGFLTAVPYVCGAICMVVVGRLSDALGRAPQVRVRPAADGGGGLLRRRLVRQADRPC